jgi:sialic acid synthase
MTHSQPQPLTLSGGTTIGPGHPCFIVAEVGNNHQGKYDLAREMVLRAAEIGLHAVKFQKRNIDALLTREGQMMPYGGTHSFGRTYGEHRLALELDIEEMAGLKELAESLGLVFFASAWDEVSLRQLASLGLKMIKICSADLVNTPLLRQAGLLGVPVIMSTGMSTWAEIDKAVQELKNFHEQIILLHCNSSYPCPEEEIALPVMAQLQQRYHLPVGYSGHERGLAPTLAAVALGACVVERHFTLNRNLPGTDHQLSLDLEQFKILVTMIKEVEKSISIAEKRLYTQEKKVAIKLRKSLVATSNLKEGHIITAEDITVKSPGTGLPPYFFDTLIGKTVKKSVYKDELLAFDTINEYF